jgi:hypothetical protein
LIEPLAEQIRFSMDNHYRKDSFRKMEMKKDDRLEISPSVVDKNITSENTMFQ